MAALTTASSLSLASLVAASTSTSRLRLSSALISSIRLTRRSPAAAATTTRLLRIFSPVPSPAPRRPFSSLTVSATISVGDRLPDATLSYFDPVGELQTVTVSELTKGKKAILFAVPGAFTPTCSQKHLPGFVEKAAELRAKGVDTIACISVNDAFVMRAWKENLGIDGDQVLLLSDGNGEFTRALGVELDLSDKPVGLGVRSRRYALLADDGVVKVLNLEEGGAFTISSAEDMLNAL